MLVSNLIEYNHFRQICFSSVNTVIIWFISEVSLRFSVPTIIFSSGCLTFILSPLREYFFIWYIEFCRRWRVNSPWYLQSSLFRDILLSMIISFSSMFDFHLSVEYVMKISRSWPLTISSWNLHSPTSSFLSWLFFICHLCHFIMTIHHLSTLSFPSWQYIRCQHSLTVDHLWCFHVILFEHRYVGVEFPKSIFSCMTHTSSRHLFIGVGLKWSSCTLVNMFTRF